MLWNTDGRRIASLELEHWGRGGSSTSLVDSQSLLLHGKDHGPHRGVRLTILFQGNL